MGILPNVSAQVALGQILIGESDDMSKFGANVVTNGDFQHVGCLSCAIEFLGRRHYGTSMVAHAPEMVASNDDPVLTTLNPLPRNSEPIGRFSRQDFAGDILDRSTSFYKWRYFIIFEQT